MAGAIIAPRGPALPSDARIYRRIGPFDAGTIPAGLLRRHDLKSGTWGLVEILAGSVRFCWDDAAGGDRLLVAGETMLVPPTVPHHLDLRGPVTIAIAFCAAAEAAASA